MIQRKAIYPVSLRRLGGGIRRFSCGTSCFGVRTGWERDDCFRFASDDQRAFRGIAGFCAEVLNAGLVFVAEVIKAQAVFFFVHDGAQFLLELLALRGVDQTFKDGVLHALAVVHALLRDLTQAFPAADVLGIDVIGDEHHHTRHLISTKTAGMRPDRPTDTAPAAAPARMAQGPTQAFPLNTDA